MKNTKVKLILPVMYEGKMQKSGTTLNVTKKEAVNLVYRGKAEMVQQKADKTDK